MAHLGRGLLSRSNRDRDRSDERISRCTRRFRVTLRIFRASYDAPGRALSLRSSEHFLASLVKGVGRPSLPRGLLAALDGLFWCCLRSASVTVDEGQGLDLESTLR